ncbi:MAG: 2-hydroxyacid dehydrogenase [Vibrio sp.]
MVVLCYLEKERGLAWQAALKQALPELQFRVWPDHGDLNDVEAIIAWKIPADILASLTNLKVIFTVSAGVDQIDFNSIPESVTVVRMINTDLEQQMAEYACTAVLSVYRQFPLYQSQHNAQQWKQQHIVPAHQYRIGVMGLGQQGKAVLTHLAAFNFALRGWASRQHDLPNVDCYAGEAEFSSFLKGLDCIICVLPLTDETHHILEHDVFEQLNTGACVINIGRGGHVNEADLLTALNSGQLGHAILDVTQQEPLSEDSPLWQQSNLLITPHIAGITRTEAGFESVQQNLQRLIKQQPLVGVVDQAAKY